MSYNRRPCRLYIELDLASFSLIEAEQLFRELLPDVKDKGRMALTTVNAE